MAVEVKEDVDFDRGVIGALNAGPAFADRNVGETANRNVCATRPRPRWIAVAVSALGPLRAGDGSRSGCGEVVVAVLRCAR
jgi:hypothetical protein